MQSTLMGVAAAEWVLDAGAHEEPVMIGMEGNKIVRKPLMQCVELVLHHPLLLLSTNSSLTLHLSYLCVDSNPPIKLTNS
jgi:hypothetical protein